MSSLPGYDAWKTSTPCDQPLRVDEDSKRLAYMTQPHHVVGESGNLIPVAESEYRVHFAPIGEGDFEVTEIYVFDLQNNPHQVTGAEFERLSIEAYNDEGVREAAAEMWIP